MEAIESVSPPRWYWIVSGIALLWMLFGMIAFVMDLSMDEAALQSMSEAERHIYTARPMWLLIAYGVAIFSGLGGVIGLLVRKAWAIPLLAVSLIAAIIQFGYVLFGLGALEVLGAAATLPFPIVILAIGTALLWLAVHAGRLGWIS